jgi:stage II sporulation protein E
LIVFTRYIKGDGEMSKAISASRIDRKEFLNVLEQITKRVVVCFAGILIARGNIGGFCPMGMGYFLALYSDKKSRFFMFLSIVLGLVTVQPLLLVIKYVAAMAVISGTISFIEINRLKVNSTKIIVLGWGILSAISLIITYTQGITQERLIMVGIESSVILLLAFIYRRSILYIFEEKEVILSKEIIISGTIIVGSAMLGSLDMEVLGISVVNFLGLALLLIVGYKYGLEASVLFGVGIGIVISSLGSGRLEEFVLWVMIGVASGIFRELGKLGALLAYTIGTLFIFNVFSQGGISIELIESLVIAEAIFLIMPLQKPILTTSNVQLEEVDINNDTNEIINSKLKQFAVTYENIARVFNNISERRTSFSNEEVNQLMDDVAEKVCKDCSMCNICWDKEFYDTYRTVYSILSAIENKGQIQKSDIPSVFYKKCIRPNEFIIMTNRILELYKVNLKWENKIIESRELVAEQFSNISDSIKQLSRNINNNLEKDLNIKRQLKKALTNNGYKINQVEINYQENSKKEIAIYFLNENEIYDIKELSLLISEVCKMKVQAVGDFNEITNSIAFTQKDQYKVGKGVAKTAKHKENISGDNFTFLSLGAGKDIIALSDGMGSGTKACVESKASIELLEYLLEGGFDVDIAIKTVNSILGLKSDQLFSTLDLSVVDRYNGVCTFIKNGAVSSFIKRDDKVEIIGNETLPLGMFKTVEYKPARKKLKDGDIVIMMSDGIYDSDTSSECKEIWLEKLIKDVDIQNPQNLADYILDKAKDNNNVIKDDMTVLVFKIWKTYKN